jgi:[acyl-carrier-protein] S-malonyltransferase
MASTLFPDGRTRSVEEFRSLAGLRNWLQRAVAFDTAP